MQKREIETMKILLANRKTEKNATVQIEHLVFVDTQANGEKPKELFFTISHQKNISFILSILKE